jgi:integrase
MNKQVLPEFQNFLLDKKLVPVKNVPFYAYWVSKFLHFSNNNENLSKEIRIKKFLNQLSTQDESSDWKIRQAYDALRLYLDHFLKETSEILYPNEQEKQKENFSLDQLIEKAREILRIKHYSYKTERSYIDWIKRFYHYISEVKKENLKIQNLSSDDVRNYLSYLAINKKVSASTQNQAFNALLFLFRDILNMELTGLNKTIRAKRGIKLPVVLSVNEVQKLFGYAKNTDLLIIQLIYGAGLRLMELARLRIKDIDFDANLIFVRSGKGDKDRSTILPEFIKSLLREHLKKVKVLHEKDLSLGYGEVYLPDALERKYPNAGKEWVFQLTQEAVK